MPKRQLTNRLNDLDSKTWLKFQKSWFVHNPPPRKKDVLRHPAKFPESLAQEFIEFFTKRGQVVLDPMVGTGSTLVAALRADIATASSSTRPTPRWPPRLLRLNAPGRLMRWTACRH
jgi:DNA modification methylase